MKKTISRISAFAIVISLIVFAAARAEAQLRGMMVPLATTVVISKPGPDQIYGSRQVITMGVGTKTYKFLLNDAYVDDPRGVIRWPDVWQAVRQYRPNFNVAGLGEDTFEKMQPGQTMTVRGMFSPNNQTFEVMSAEPGAGNSEPAQHY
jgi:hypothetical protein